MIIFTCCWEKKCITRFKW